MYTCGNTWVSMCMCVCICIYIEAIRLPLDSADCSGHSPTHLSPFITKVSSLLLLLFSLEDQSKSGQITTLKLLRRDSPYNYVTIQHIVMSIVFISCCFQLLIATCLVFFYNCVKYSFGFTIKYTKWVLSWSLSPLPSIFRNDNNYLLNFTIYTSFVFF